jgi:hypothetical protein
MNPVVIFLILMMMMVGLAIAGYFAYDKYFKKAKPATGSPATGSPGELIITGEGATMSKTEKYIEMPDLSRCYRESGEMEEYCSAYDKNENNGFAFVYDLTVGDSRGYNSCPGGGHDCWYIEKYDNEGTMIDVVNKDGKSMLNAIADDVWNDKWDMENVRLVKEASGIFEFKDGKLVAKKKFGARGTEFEVGDIIKPTDFPSSLYFIGLFIAMKLANAEKPTKITVNIKNAKALFDKLKIGRRGDPTDSPSGVAPLTHEQQRQLQIDRKEMEKTLEVEPEIVLSEVEKAARDAAVRARIPTAL